MKPQSFLIFLIVLLISCKNQNPETERYDSEQNEIVIKEQQETTVPKLKTDQTQMIEQLQGKWREHEYPYRTAEFVGSTVKFIEEGTPNTPEFEKFEVTEECRFDNQNIRDLKTSDIILTLPETERCEKLKVSNDTLTLSGFSTNSNADYHIIYLKFKQ